MWVARTISIAGSVTLCLRSITNLNPSDRNRNTNFWLSCQYKLDQHPKQDQLYSVKWYKNNEEFYRLLLAPSDQSTAQDEISSPNQQQQHYFAQAGVNVMMSSSNATHVRLLNASLESEGIYACEISTQNLSTIRYEREIRVYVLPQTRLNIIGFRNGYSLGDKVDLICSSDFSRPKPAVAWFINGQRIGQSNRWFEQELETRAKLHEPSLFKLNLRLKFKLSHEFLVALAVANQSQRKKQASSLGDATNQADQSQTTGSFGSVAAGLTRLQQPQTEKFELQCRYKLAEVSDVTYNELALTRQQGNGVQDALPVGAASLEWPAESAGGKDEESERKFVAGEWSAARRKRRMMTNGDDENQLVRVNKSPDGNQVTQSKSPADGRELWRSIQSQAAEQSCQLGSLALLPDDPVIIEPTSQIGRGERRHRKQSHRRSSAGYSQETQPEMIRVNCSTAGALETARGADDAARDLGHKAFQWIRGDEEEEGYESFGNAGPTDNNNSNKRNEPSSSYCNDHSAQRRLLVSGKSLIVNELPLNQRPRGRSSGHKAQVGGRQLVAYLSLAQHNNGPGNLTAPQNSDPTATGDNNPDNNNNSNHDVIEPHRRPGSPLAKQYRQFGPTMTTAALTTSPTNADSSDFSSSDGGPSGIPLAPPLLEWFINNQEAPRASASYSPELPLLGQNELRLAEQPTVDLASGHREETSEVLPPIDYANYFANFDSRPQKQHLILNLRPDKKHFLTTDSKLRLRCSSTKAQVLVSDLASLTVVPLSSTGTAQGHGGWQPRGRQLKQQQQQQQQKGSHQMQAGRVLSPTLPATGTRSSGSGSRSRNNPPGLHIVGLVTATLALLLFAHLDLGSHQL